MFICLAVQPTQPYYGGGPQQPTQPYYGGGPQPYYAGGTPPQAVSPQAYYGAPQPATVVVQGGFDAGARFDGVAQPNIPVRICQHFH